MLPASSVEDDNFAAITSPSELDSEASGSSSANLRNKRKSRIGSVFRAWQFHFMIKIDLRDGTTAAEKEKRSMKKWIDSATWKTVLGGLTSDNEYMSNMRRFQDPNDKWTRRMLFGSIGANNVSNL